MELHIGEEMELVVEVEAAHEALHGRLRGVLLHQSLRVGHTAVDGLARGVECLVVAAIGLVVHINR